ncbi:MAG: ABC transporter ATP-binding protein [Muricomes sp.]
MRKLLPFLRGYEKESIIGPLFKMLEAVFELIVPLVMAQIIDVGIRQNNEPYIWKLAALLVVLGLLGLVCSVTAQYYAAKAAAGFGTGLRHALFEHIQKLSYTQIDKAGSSTLVVRMTSDINQAQNGVNQVLRLFLRSPFIVAGALIMAFMIDTKMAVIFVVTVPLLALVIYGITALSIPLYKKVQKGLDKILLSTRENLEGIRVIRAFRTQNQEKEEYEKKSSDLMEFQLQAGRISALLNPLTYVLVNLGIIAIIWYGGASVNKGGITQGEVIALVNYMTQILLSLVTLAILIISFTKAMASAVRINEVFDLKTGMEEGTRENGYDSEEVPRVEMQDVTFYYEGSQEPALSHITFQAYSGETIGIIGGTGSGKTSLVNLIPRFYDVKDGHVRVNGLDAKDWKIDSLRNCVGVVPQKAILFYGTIRQNMQMGKADAGDDEIRDALKTAQALEIVESKPAGLDTIISEGGKNLSGGQKQRLTIARALVRKPQILILDDSASALDFATDYRLRKALSSDTSGMTVFIVSQRASSIRYADRIIVLDDGEMAGYGTHEELLKECKIYQEICYSQLSKEEVH